MTTQSYTSTLFKTGNSTAIRLPKTLIDSLQLKIDDPVNITSENNSIIISPVNHPKPDSVVVNGVLEILKSFFKGLIGNYTETSESNLNLEVIHDLNIKAYKAPLYSKKKKTCDILIPVQYVTDFNQLLSFLYDYFLIVNKNSGFQNVIISNREALFNKWFHDSHIDFYNTWDVNKSIYYDWMKGCVLNGSE